MTTKPDADYWHKMEVEVPSGFEAAASAAARRLHMRTGEFCKQILIAAIEEVGVWLEDFEPAA
jgi:hypothetical protein